MTTPAVAARTVTKRFGTITAVDGVSVEIAGGEFFSLLGPSGSGKTTMLRMIAGFELPTSGRIELDGEDVTRQPPFDRDVNTVFQDYALFPHMNVRKNVEYGLRVKGVAKSERRERAEAALHTVRLEAFGERKPDQLSGGQRQRVALARALVNEPKVLLLDEPLGALDRKLREEMQLELARIQRDVGITFIFVTHDQGEALTLSSRVAVFNAGRIEQVGTPREIYEAPATEFVASFVGTTSVIGEEAAAALLGESTARVLRPERVRMATAATAPEGCVQAPGTVADVQYHGDGTRVRVEIDAGASLVAELPNRHEGESVPALGDRVTVEFDRSDLMTLERSTSHDQPIGEKP
ncbi:MAG: ABC transporter ATP-binding protein [Acidimicrobiia bacterium]|nr:ABC transporter ATP-binding protein [Acidimicrobiia bacterium]